LTTINSLVLADDWVYFGGGKMGLCKNFSSWTTTTTPVSSPLSGTTRWAATRKIKPIWIYWGKRQWMAVTSAGPYVNLHLAPDT